MASGATVEKSYSILLWVESPAGFWNAILQVSKSPKGDLKVDPFKAKLVEADDGSHTAMIARVLNQESNQLFTFDQALLPAEAADVLHLHLRFPEGENSLASINSLYEANAKVLHKDAAEQKGLAIVYAPLMNLKEGLQPTSIRITPQGMHQQRYTIFQF